MEQLFAFKQTLEEDVPVATSQRATLSLLLLIVLFFYPISYIMCKPVYEEGIADETYIKCYSQKADCYGILILIAHFFRYYGSSWLCSVHYWR